MKKLWVIYDKKQYDANAWFADRLTGFLGENFDAELAMAEEISGTPDVAVVRTIDPGLSRKLEERGAVVINTAEISRIANDKRLSCVAAAEACLPMAETFFFDRNCPESIENGAFPIVLKTVSGHGGREVFLCWDRVSLNEALAKTEGKEVLAQRLVGDGSSGRDVRVYVLGGEIFKSVIRISDSGFRSNFTLGGRAEPYELNPEEKRAVDAVLAKLGKRIDFIGVDFLWHEGSLLFNEIEDVAGTRMLYSVYGIDAARVLADYINAFA